MNSIPPAVHPFPPASTRGSRAFLVFALVAILRISLGLTSWASDNVESPEPTPAVSVATFVCDVTPPLGHPLCGGWIKPLEAVDDPLLAKGIVLAFGKDRYVLCAVDWCLLQTDAYDRWVRAIADAVDLPVSHVALHTVHQHNAPIADTRAEELLAAMPSAPRHLDLEFFAEVTDRVAAAVRAALPRLEPVTHVGYGLAPVQKFASNRRVRLADGEIHVRYSATRDPVLQAAPEGLIDPHLRTVSLFAGERPLVRLHYYATHPMSFYGDGRATADTVGLARERLEREERIPQIYFTGCGGNLTAGKYNEGSPSARQALTERVAQAMRAAVAQTHRAPLRDIDWKTVAVRFTPRPEPRWSIVDARRRLADTNETAQTRLTAALDLAWAERLQRQPGVTLSRLRLGPVTLLHLPGESFIEYQLYAQSLRPRDFVAVAAYGESGPGYICCDAALSEGGYEPTMSRVGPPSEVDYKKGIAALMAPVPTTPTPFYPDKLRLLWWRDRQGREHPIRRAEDWSKRRTHILAAMQAVMGPRPEAGRDRLHWRIEETAPQQGYVRHRVSWAGGDGDLVPAHLLIPDQPRSARLPAMLCLHQTTPAGKAEPAGLAGNPNLHYARELAQRGYVTLAPDYPNFGDYPLNVYGLGYGSATLKGIVNHQRGLDLLSGLSRVDKRRIGVIGHSLGGHNALFLAAFDHRVRAVITSCGFNSFFKYADGNLRGWSHAGYMPRIATAYASDPKQMPFDFTEVLAAAAPRPVFIHAPLADDNFEVSGVRDCVAAARPVYALFGAERALEASHPEGGHDFPTGARERAYRWLDGILQAPPLSREPQPR